MHCLKSCVRICFGCGYWKNYMSTQTSRKISSMQRSYPQSKGHSMFNSVSLNYLARIYAA